METKPKMEDETETISGKKRFIEIFSILKDNNVLGGMNPQKFRKILEELGPTFIKIGQILSNRPDMLPKEYINELSKLRSDVKPMSYYEVVKIIEEQYQKKIHEVFLSIDKKCVGSASIAQVHKARLLNGDSVVVKVQRQNIRNIMTSDIKVLKKVCHVLKLQQVFKNIISFDDTLDELLNSAYEEMNFLKEASYMEEFRNLNKDVLYVKIPKVYNEFCCEKVLVMEYVAGIEIDDKDKLVENGYDLEEIGSKLADNYIYQAVDCGLFHADPHPDNIFIEDGKIVYLDFGMVGRINNRDKELLKNCIFAILENDINEVERNLLILGDTKGEVNHNKLRREIESILDKNKGMEIKEINITVFANEMLNMLGSNNITLPKDITMLIRGIVVLEGTLETVTPSINLMQVLKNRFESQTFKEIFKKSNVRNTLKDTAMSLNSIRKIPNDLHVLLNEATRGEVKFNVEVTDSNKQIDRLEKMVHRIVVCALDVAFIVGASLIASNDVVTSEQQFLYYLYIILGIIFTIWLFIKMYIDKLNRKK